MPMPMIVCIFYSDPNGPVAIPTAWPEYNMATQRYLDITSPSTVTSLKGHFAAKRMAFWLEILPDVLISNTTET